MIMEFAREVKIFLLQLNKRTRIERLKMSSSNKRFNFLFYVLSIKLICQYDDKKFKYCTFSYAIYNEDLIDYYSAVQSKADIQYEIFVTTL